MTAREIALPCPQRTPATRQRPTVENRGSHGDAFRYISEKRNSGSNGRYLNQRACADLLVSPSARAGLASETQAASGFGRFASRGSAHTTIARQLQEPGDSRSLAASQLLSWGGIEQRAGLLRLLAHASRHSLLRTRVRWTLSCGPCWRQMREFRTSRFVAASPGVCPSIALRSRGSYRS
jgi:hypothetical protein